MTVKHLYTLIFVPDEAERIVNSNGRPSIGLYVDCAENLGRSLAGFASLGVITNKVELVQRLAGPCPAFAIIGHNFTLDVPKGIAFRSAHFKLEVLDCFGRGEFGAAPVILDSDIVANGPLRSLSNQETSICAYDITEQMAGEIGLQRIRSDLELLTQEPVTSPRWYGGEWISATASNFRRLSDEISSLWPRYIANLSKLGHVGDEALLTAALMNLERQGLNIQDAGKEQIIRRWWSARTNFAQAPLRELADISLWHLPSDKDFLSLGRQKANNHGHRILSEYQEHVRWKLIGRRVMNPILNLLRHERKYVGRL